jgi:concanavalin A-like lectin/glucanase superfamily protein
MGACTHRFLVAVVAAVGLLIAAPAAGASIVGEWAFDEGSGQVAHDRSGSGLDGDLGIAPGPDGADPVWLPGIAGSALRFDGGDAVVVPDSAALEPANLSIEAWVRRLGTPGTYAYVVSKGSRGCDFSSYGLYTGGGGGMAFYVSDGNDYVVSPHASPARVWDGAWHHVVGSFDGHSVRLYLDGAEVGSGSPTDHPIAYGLASTAPYIGTYRGGCDLGFTGDVDDVRIWSPSLTAAEVAASVPTQPSSGGGGGGGPGAPTPPVSGAPPALAPSCVVSVPRKTLRAGRRNSLVVTVLGNESPLRNVRVLLSGRKTRAVHRTDRKGRARFVVRPLGSERRLTVRALGRTCRNTSITVRR